MPFNIFPLIRAPARWLPLFLLGLILAACGTVAPAATNQLRVIVETDGKQQVIEVEAGTSVQAALDSSNIVVNALDRIDPPGFTILTQPTLIRVIRVREEFRVEEKSIAFAHQTVRNESLPEGQTLLIQSGMNGLQRITYRQVFDDGQEVSNGIFKIDIITEARPEIVMVGVQAPFLSTPISGRLAYLTAGNAWVMEKTTGKRRPVVTTGDLDGRVFRLAPDGNWLLYTRKSDGVDPSVINTLWAVSLTAQEPRPINLKVNNTIHYADWVPGTQLTVAYSTVEARSAAPGWQANNDLQMISFTASGAILRSEMLLEANSGGIYGWWGTTFAWSPDGSRLAYARPDSVGIVDLQTQTFNPLLEILPLQTRADWAWVPGLDWSPDGSTLYSVNHAIMAGMNTPEESPLFDLTAIPLQIGAPVPLVGMSGMFAYPTTSPSRLDSGFQVAYLQAIFPEQSETSNYRVMIMDRDGSNHITVFPAEGSPGVSPQQVVWSPPDGEESNETWLGIVYQGNLWFVQTETGASRQISGDGSISRIDWK